MLDNTKLNAKDNLICEDNIIHLTAVTEAKNKMPAEDILYNAAELFKVFGDNTRIRILSALTVTELCVCDLCALLGMTKSAVSHQLRILRQARLVKSKRMGKEILYSLDDSHVNEILMTAFRHINE